MSQGMGWSVYFMLGATATVIGGVVALAVKANRDFSAPAPEAPGTQPQEAGQAQSESGAGAGAAAQG
ncbi:MAG: hypothetical protein HYZ53_12590 [Planctomycetes bacterium]|nr:hypothetical protein [Planctomycetota bacterium]